jgi:hypothetical protein
VFIEHIWHISSDFELNLSVGGQKMIAFKGESRLNLVQSYKILKVAIKIVPNMMIWPILKSTVKTCPKGVGMIKNAPLILLMFILSSGGTTYAESNGDAINIPSDIYLVQIPSPAGPATVPLPHPFQSKPISPSSKNERHPPNSDQPSSESLLGGDKDNN